MKRPVSMELVEALELIRREYGSPIHITSGVRCAKHNEAIGGSRLSRHVVGDAVDVACTDSAARYRLVELAMKHGVKCIKVYPKHLHLDMRPGHFIFLDSED